tara:strand:- start:632 stop:991 length:360 start_codon:yes stop_codon:yes gene_type:complete
MELVDDICDVFPDDVDIQSAKNSFILIKKANPKLLIRSWDMFVVQKYHQEIVDGKIEYFLQKDYREDLELGGNNTKQIVDAIDRLRAPIRSMNKSEQDKILKYLQNLCKLTLIFKQEEK